MASEARVLPLWHCQLNWNKEKSTDCVHSRHTVVLLIKLWGLSKSPKIKINDHQPGLSLTSWRRNSEHVTGNGDAESHHPNQQQDCCERLLTWQSGHRSRWRYWEVNTAAKSAAATTLSKQLWRRHGFLHLNVLNQSKYKWNNNNPIDFNSVETIFYEHSM